MRRHDAVVTYARPPITGLSTCSSSTAGSGHGVQFSLFTLHSSPFDWRAVAFGAGEVEEVAGEELVDGQLVAFGELIQHDESRNAGAGLAARRGGRARA